MIEETSCLRKHFVPSVSGYRSLYASFANGLRSLLTAVFHKKGGADLCFAPDLEKADVEHIESSRAMRLPLLY